MAYTAWTVVFGEQPTASKWNALGVNDGGFKDGSLIDDGAITVPKLSNPYKASAYRDAAWTTPAGTSAKVALDTESWDDNNNFTGGTYNVPVAGKYLITARVSASNLIRLFASIYKNGVEAARGTDIQTSGAVEQGSVVNKELSLAIGDTIELYVWTSAAVTGATTDILTYMSIHLLSV